MEDYRIEMQEGGILINKLLQNQKRVPGNLSRFND